MTELFAVQTTLVLDIMKQLGNSSYTEVGCGTAELGAVLQPHAVYSVGVEINPIFLSLARSLHPSLELDNVSLIKGNAVYLQRVLSDAMPQAFWDTHRVVSMVMNTFGILPAAIQQDVVDEMVKVMGRNGTVVIGCWHSESFEQGVTEFYKKNPELCGIITEDMVDYQAKSIFVPSTEYSTHWWSASELRGYFLCI